MIKKTITFKDLDGNDITEDFYFALSAADITNIVVSDDELMGFFEKIAKKQEGEDVELKGKEIIELFQKLIKISVGKRGADNKQFVKNDEIRNELLQSDAYSVLFIEFATDTPKAIEFFNGIMPSNLPEIIAQIEAARAKNEVEAAAVTSGQTTDPAWVTEGRLPTDEELKNATPDQLRLAFQRKVQGPEVIPSQ